EEGREEGRPEEGRREEGCQEGRREEDREEGGQEKGAPSQEGGPGRDSRGARAADVSQAPVRDPGSLPARPGGEGVFLFFIRRHGRPEPGSFRHRARDGGRRAGDVPGAGATGG